VIDTNDEQGAGRAEPLDAGAALSIGPHSLAVFVLSP
jgi:hypothetical protein